MKLSKAGEPRGNRFTRAGEVIHPPTDERIWDESDVRLLKKILSNKPFHSSTMSYSLISLKIISSLDLEDEGQLRRVVMREEDDLVEEIGSWGNRNWPSKQVLGDLGYLLLLNPNSKENIRLTPEFKADAVKVWSELYSPEEALGYILLFPQTTTEIRGKIADRLLTDIDDYEPTGQLPLLAAVRLINPARFAAQQVSDEWKAEFLAVVRGSKQDFIENGGTDPQYPENFLNALIVLAEEAQLTANGLEVKFAPAPIRNSPTLPERNTV